MKKTIFLSILIFFLILQSCSLKFLSEEAFEEINGLNNYEVDVYVCGSYDDGSGYKVCYWKNNKLITEIEGKLFNSSQANAISIIGNDIYMSGYCDQDTNPAGLPLRAAYWKNGKLFYLNVDYPNVTANSSQALSICCQSGVIYTAGSEYNASIPQEKACFWINQEKIDLGIIGQVKSIFADDNLNIYIAGQDTANNRGFYSINGITTFLNTNTFVSSMFIKNDTVYLSGTSNGIAVCWKENNIIINTGMPSGITSTSVWVNDNNEIYSVYSGNQLYKNNNYTTLIDPVPFTGTATASSIYIWKDKIFLTGVPNNVGYYWTNNGQTYFTLEAPSDNTAMSICAVKKR